MCGLIYCENFAGKAVNGFIMHQFEDQKHRGTEGFGLYDKDRACLHRSTKERKTMSYLKNRPSSAILFHHRFPTSTANVKNACHPFGTKDFFKTSYVLAHNGVVQNPKELKAEHDKLGIVYNSIQPDGSFNDSEALLWDVALYLEGKQTELKAYGSIAFICMAFPKDKRKHDKLYFARNSSPLNMVFSGQHLILSSEGPGEPIEQHSLYQYDYRTLKMESSDLEVPNYAPYTGSLGSLANYHGYGAYGGLSEYGYESQEDQDYWDQYYASLADAKQDDDDVIDHVVNAYAGYTILPDSSNFDYDQIYPEVQNELVYQRRDGSQLNVKQAVADRVDLYLEAADGNYYDAFAFLKSDIRAYMQQLLADIDDDLPEDEDLVLEIDILEAAKHCFNSCPYWTGTQSVDPSYNSSLGSAIRTFLSGKPKIEERS